LKWRAGGRDYGVPLSGPFAEGRLVIDHVLNVPLVRRASLGLCIALYLVPLWFATTTPNRRQTMPRPSPSLQALDVARCSALQHAIQGVLRRRNSERSSWYNRMEKELGFGGTKRRVELITSLWLTRPEQDFFVNVDYFDVDAAGHGRFSARASGSVRARAYAGATRPQAGFAEWKAHARIQIWIAGTARIENGVFRDCNIKQLEYELTDLRIADLPLNTCQFIQEGMSCARTGP